MVLKIKIITKKMKIYKQNNLNNKKIKAHMQDCIVQNNNNLNYQLQLIIRLITPKNIKNKYKREPNFNKIIFYRSSKNQKKEKRNYQMK